MKQSLDDVLDESLDESLTALPKEEPLLPYVLEAFGAQLYERGKRALSWAGKTAKLAALYCVAGGFPAGEQIRLENKVRGFDADKATLVNLALTAAAWGYLSYAAFQQYPVYWAIPCAVGASEVLIRLMVATPPFPEPVPSLLMLPAYALYKVGEKVAGGLSGFKSDVMEDALRRRGGK